MRPIFTVHATANEKATNHFEVIRRLSRAMISTYKGSRGGTRTPDPVINSHLLSPEEKAQQARKERKAGHDRTAVDAKSLRPATVHATALQNPPDLYANSLIFTAWRFGA